MELKAIFIGSAISLLGYLIQIRPRIYNRYFGVDTWRNLSIADYIRKHKRLPNQLPKYMLKGPFDYPPFLNIILSILPKKFVEEYQGFISPIFDTINSAIIFTISYLITVNLSVAIFAQLIYILSPMVVIENASLNARSLGSLFFTLAFLTSIFYSINHYSLLFLFAILFTTIMLFSQKMAAQTMFFLSSIFSIVDRNASYILIFGISVLLATVISRGFYLRVVVGQLSVLKYFRMIANNRYAHQVRGISPAAKNKDFIENLKNAIREYPLFALAGSFPLTTLGFLLSLWLLSAPKSSFLLHYPWLVAISFKLALWVTVLYIFGIITAQIKPFQFLGEGIKYLVYACLPAAFIISLSVFDALNNGGGIFLFITAICLIFLSLVQIIFIQNKGIINDKMRSVTPSLKRIMDFLEKQPSEVKLATIPFSLSDCIAYFTKSNILSSDSAYVLGHDPEYLDFYPVLRRPLEEILNKHDINYLLVDKNYAAIEELKLIKKDIILEEGNLCLIKR